MKKIMLCSLGFLIIALAVNVYAGTSGKPVKPASPFDGPAQAPQTVMPPVQMAPGATASTWNVPGDFATIQAAIDGATSGDIINVGAGTWAEAILIDGKNLTIAGAGAGSSIITGTATNTDYIVKMDNSAAVDFSGFTVDGTGKNIRYGIYAYNGVDGDIHDCEIKNIQYPGALGLAIRRQECYIDVTDNDVYGFGRIGIYTRDDVIGNTDTGVISGNTVTGLGGLDAARLSYGISVYSGNPTVTGNDIYDCISGADVSSWLSAGCDVWTGSTSVISNNNFYNSECGILSNSASPVMSGNTFTDISGDDVRLDYFVKGNPTPHWAEYYDTIQDGIDAVPVTSYKCLVWIGVYSGGGTYAEAVNVNKTCRIYGDSRATVLVNPVGHAVNNAGIYVDADDVIISGLTLQGSNTNSLPRYGIKFADNDGCYLDDVEVRNVYRTGVDILGATNLSVSNVELKDNGGNGMQACDARDVTFEDITTSNNAWGGVAVFTWGQYTPIGTWGIVFTGTNSFGETAADVGGIYLEEGNFAVPTSPYPITFSTNILDGADVTVQLADVTHTLKGNSDNDNYYTRFYATLADAQTAAAGAVSHILDGRYITELAGTNLYVPANLGGIQAAVDGANPGDVIHVDAGTYVEQVVIDKNLTLDGAGKGSTVIESPASLATAFVIGTYNNYAVVYVHDAADVTVSNLTVDGLGLGNANYRFVGVGYRNAGGEVSSCEILDIRDNPLSGAQHGIGLYMYNDDAVARSLDVLDNDISGFQKNAMALNADASTAVALDVTGNTVTGAGVLGSGLPAQNGIQASGALVTGTIENNVVTDIAYSGGGWVATSILLYYGNFDVAGNSISGSHMGIYLIDGSGSITGNTLAMEKIGGYCWGIAASDPPEAVPSPFDMDVSGPMATSGLAMAPAAVLDLDISGNSVVFSGPDNTGTFGIEVDAGYSANDLAVTADGNVSTGFESGMDFWVCTSECDAGVFTSIEAHGNDLSDNTYGMRSVADYITVDATGNWWGDASGPYHATLNPGGTGSEVSDYIDFDPYMTGLYDISATPVYGITNCSTSIVYTFSIAQAGFGGSEVRGYDVTFQIDPGVVTIASTATDVVELDYLEDVAGTAFYVLDKGAGEYTVSCAILGGSDGPTGAGDLFTVAFTPVAEGVSAIDITTLKLRDVDNVPIDVGGNDGEVQIDCTPPLMQAIVETENECYNAAPTFATFTFRDDVNLDLAEYQIDSDGWLTIFPSWPDTVWTSPGWELPGFAGLAEGTHTVYFRVKDDAGNWNGEGTPDTYTWSFVKDTTPPAAPTDFLALPGYNRVHLTWTNPTGDASFEGVEIRKVGWGDYPQYGTPGPAEPAYPADETEGAPVVVTGLEAYDDDPATPRDIYYYAAFSYDCAGNYSAATPTSRDRSTSYWLGDVSPSSVGDGQIQILDLSAFSLTFGVLQGGGGWNAEGDFGPTDDYSRFGIPEPDDVVDFEDLMIFAMNYQNVSPAGTSERPLVAGSERVPLGDQVGFRLMAVERDGDLATYAVVIENQAKTMKGFSLAFDYGVGNELVELKASSRLTGKGGEHFFGTVERESGVVEICVAALGVNKAFEYTGEVARVVVRESGTAQATLTRADLRDLDNRRDEVALGDGGDTPYMPSVSGLMQNHPNPFNPTTTIAYDVAEAGHVSIEVYDVSGRLVQRLVNAHKDAGRHQASWNGRDMNGNSVHTGVYFYRMSAPGYQSPAKKMLLLK